MPIFSASPGRAANRQPAARDRAVEVRDPEHEVHQVRGEVGRRVRGSCVEPPRYPWPFFCRRLQPLRWKDRVMPRPQQKRRVTDPLSFRGVSQILWIPNYHERPCRVSQFSHSFVLPSCENETTIDSEKSSNFIGPEKRNGKSPCANLEAEIHHLGCTWQHGCSIDSWTSKLHAKLEHFDCAVLGSTGIDSRVEIFRSFRSWKDSQLLTNLTGLLECTRSSWCIHRLHPWITPMSVKDTTARDNKKGPDFFSSVRCFFFSDRFVETF